MSLIDLPNELVQQVILLTKPTTIGVLSCVSTYWNSVCEDADMWKQIYNDNFGGPTDLEYKDSLISNYVAMKEIVNANDKLVWAVVQGHHKAIRVLFSTTDADINYYEPILKCSLLYLACGKGNLKVVTELLNCGAQVEVGNKISETPLQVASKLGNAAIVSLLLSHKANVNGVDKYGRSALHKAVYEGRTAIVGLLLQTMGINVELRELCYGQTALHVACAFNHGDIASLLLRAHSNINAVDWDGWTPLHLACFKGNKSVVTALLSHDAAHVGKQARESRLKCLNGSPGHSFIGAYREREREADAVSLFSNTVK